MPRFTEITAEQRDKLKSLGADVDNRRFIYDNETGNAMPADEAPGMGFGEHVQAGLANVPTGVGQSVASFPEVAASGTGALRQLGVSQGLLGPFNSPEFLRGVAGLIKRKASDAASALTGGGDFTPDARAGMLETALGQGVGQVLGSFLPAAGMARAAQAVGFLPQVAGRLAGTGASVLSGGMTAADTIQEELQRQQASGERPDEVKALVKGAGIGTLGGVLEGALGAGPMFKMLDLPVKTLSRQGLKEGLKLGSKGFLEEGGTRLGQELGVYGIDRLAGSPEDQAAAIGQIILEGGVGGILNPAVGGVMNAVSGAPVAPQEVTGAAAKPAEAGGMLKVKGKTPEISTEGAALTPPELPPQQRLNDDEISTILRMPVDSEPPNSNAFYRQLKKGREAGIVNNIEDVRELEAAAIEDLKGEGKSTAATEKALNNIWMRKMQQQPAASAEEAANAIQSGYFDFFVKTFPKESAELDKLQKSLDDMRGWFEKKAPEFQAKGLVGELAAAQANITRAETQLRNKSVELLRSWNEMHAPVPRPVALLGRQGETALPTGQQGPAIPSERPIRGLLEQSNTPIVSKENLYTPAAEGTNPAIPMGMSQSAAEKAILSGQAGTVKTTPEEILRQQQRAKERAILTGQEGEQSYPFGEGTRYSAILPPSMLAPAQEALRRLRKFTGEEQVQDRTYILSAVSGLNEDRPFGIPLTGSGELPTAMPKSFDPGYLLTRGTTSRMAQQGPTGGLIKYLHDVFLSSRRDGISHQLTEMLAPAEKFAKSQRGKDILEFARDNKTWDIEGLSPEEQAGLDVIKGVVEFTREYANENGILVGEIKPNGEKVMRPGRMIPGWTPIMPGEQVYNAAASGGTEWTQLRKDFIDNWKAHFGPDSSPMAEAAMEHIIPSLPTNKGGEPLFSPVILPKGLDLPKSWQSKSPWDGLVRYIRRYSQHVAWAQTIQNTAAGRAAFGLKEDAAGRPSQPVNWSDLPQAWTAAVREGRKSNAKWALDADPNAPPATPIEAFYGPELVDSLLLGFKQGSSDNPLIQAANSAGSAWLIGTVAGMRDVATGITQAAQYGGVVNSVRNTLDYVTGGRKKILSAARSAGAMTGDVLAPEAISEGGAVAQGVQDVARFGRWITGRQELDQMGKAIIFQTVKMRPELVEEFGPVDENMSMDEKMAWTAARLSRRVSNTADPSNLPPWLLPQSKSAASKFFGLARWGVGQYNNFKEDVIFPMFQGKKLESMKRFLTLTMGTAVGSSVVNAFANWLFDRKPDNLTWGEWLRLWGDKDVPMEKKVDELAYTALANMQLGGWLGWVGDLGLAGVRAKVGGRQMGSMLDAQYPLFIAAKQTADSVMSYWSALRDGRASGKDFFQLMQSIMTAGQTGRIFNRVLELTGVDNPEIRKPVRDSEIVRRVFDTNPKTGREEGPAAGMKAVAPNDPFSATRQALRISEEDYPSRLGGFLKETRRTTGRPFQINRWKQWPGYYDTLARVIGEEAAKNEEAKAAELDETIRRKNRALREASR